MEDFIITTADKKDIDEVKAVNELCLPENYTRDIYETLVGSTIICRHRNSGKIVGYVISANLESTDPDILPFSRQHAQSKRMIHTVVFSLAVLPEYRKKGIGSRLLKIVIDAHKKFPVLLHARKSNDTARRIYAKFGFDIIKESPSYYHEPNEDGLVMVYLKGANKDLKKYLKYKPETNLADSPNPADSTNLADESKNTTPAQPPVLTQASNVGKARQSRKSRKSGKSGKK